MWVNEADKRFQKIQGAPEDIDKQTEEPGDCEAEEIARRKAEVENVRRKVEEAIRNAGYGKMNQWQAEVKRRVDEKARAAELEVKAEDAKCRAEAAGREAEAARVVVLEAVSDLEKAAASETAHAAYKEARDARYWADRAKGEASSAASQAAQLWVYPIEIGNQGLFS